MSKLQAIREGAAQLVGEATGAQAHPFMPARIDPPSVIVLPGSPYLEPSGTFGTFTVNLEVVVVSPSKVNETASDVLDDLIIKTIVNLVNANVTVNEVSDVWAITVSNAEYLAATITTSQPVTL